MKVLKYDLEFPNKYVSHDFRTDSVNEYGEFDYCDLKIMV